MHSYIKTPSEIYARSFEIIRGEVDLNALPASAHAIATRVIHACGMVEVAQELVISDRFAETATQEIGRAHV